MDKTHFESQIEQKCLRVFGVSIRYFVSAANVNGWPVEWVDLININANDGNVNNGKLTFHSVDGVCK